MDGEKIKAAAIRYRLKDLDKPEICTGPNHAFYINWFSFAEIPMSKRDMAFETQGFVTTTGRFVDRVEALEIAKREHQVSEFYDKPVLYSDFCNFVT